MRIYSPRHLLSLALTLAVLIFPLSCNEKRGPIICGGIANYICPARMFCYFESNCGGEDGEGVCVLQPLTCPDDQEKVCGCDGKTYSSACFAAANGVSVRQSGPCDGHTR